MIKYNDRIIEPTVFPDKTSQVWRIEESAFYESNTHLIQWKYDHAVRTIKNVGLRLQQEKYWYSESKDAMHLLDVIGEGLKNSDDIYLNMNNLRDKWRAKIRENKN